MIHSRSRSHIRKTAQKPADIDDTVRIAQQNLAAELSGLLRRDKKKLPASIRSAFVADPETTRYTRADATSGLAQTPLSTILGTGGGRGGGGPMRG
jgi:hypothetical protein